MGVGLHVYAYKCRGCLRNMCEWLCIYITDILIQYCNFFISDEEDDSPMIRGFSDDEPLVIA